MEHMYHEEEEYYYAGRWYTESDHDDWERYFDNIFHQFYDDDQEAEKPMHVEWIKEKVDSDVLYYKQYKKNGKYLGCGDLTIDTKEAMDKLLNKDEMKAYEFDKYAGTYYRYNKKNRAN